MPLNQSEAQQTARALLKCFGEDSSTCGRTLKFISSFTNGQVNLLGTLKTEALTWQPFINSGLSIQDWNIEVERNYNQTDVS